MLISLIIASFLTHASTETKRIVTPRGSEIEVTSFLDDSTSDEKTTLILAPGARCRGSDALFAEIAKQATAAKINVVKFAWSYCLIDPENPNPSDNLVNEIEDFNAAVDYAKSLSTVDDTKLIYVGKSLGSFVAFDQFKGQSDILGTVLLTPVCSVTKGNDPTPISVWEENYPGLKLETRNINLITGNKDELCRVRVFFDYVQDVSKNVSYSLVQGDHGFRVKNPDGSVNEPKTTLNFSLITQKLIRWIQKVAP